MTNDTGAGGAESLFELLYDELKIIAKAHMQRQGEGHSLQPTALVNEAFLKLKAGKGVRKWESEKHFFCTVAEVMRQILVDSARSKAAKKRGGDFVRVELNENDTVQIGPEHDVLALHDALLKFEAVSKEKVQLVMLRYFAGLSLTEAAEHLSISRATAYNYWDYSRAWLYRELTSES